MSVWASIAWILSISGAGFGIITGGAVPDAGGHRLCRQLLRRRDRRARSSATTIRNDPPGKPLPVLRAIMEGLKTALLAMLVYLFALPFLLFVGVGLLILFLRAAPICSAANISNSPRCAFVSPEKPRRSARRNAEHRIHGRTADRRFRLDPDRQPRDATVRHGDDGAYAQEAVRAAAIELIERRRWCRRRAPSCPASWHRSAIMHFSQSGLRATQV